MDQTLPCGRAQWTEVKLAKLLGRYSVLIASSIRTRGAGQIWGNRQYGAEETTSWNRRNQYMRKLIEATFVSLDGVVGSPEKWALPFFDDENKSYALSRLSEFDAFLLGRVTYEKFAASWSRIKGDAYFDRINSLPKFVPSTTLRETTRNATLIKGDVVEEVSRLKNQSGKNIMKYGAGQLDRTLVQHNLIDEFHFSIFPIAVGSGQRLFEGIDTTHLKLKLTGTTRFGNGVVVLSYQPAGA